MSVRVAESHSGEPGHNREGKLPGQGSSNARPRETSTFPGSGNRGHAGVIFIFLALRTDFSENLGSIYELRCRLKNMW